MENLKPGKPMKKTVRQLLLLTVGMFGFGFLLVPLYDVICDLTGINGKVELVAYEMSNEQVLSDRTINIQFVALNNADMSWGFKPKHNSMLIHPGQPYLTTFNASNPSARTMTAQAVPSISPGYAAKYFHKMQCFCFDQQQLEAGQSEDMGLRFVIDSEIPEEIHTITLTYTIFDVTPTQTVTSIN